MNEKTGLKKCTDCSRKLQRYQFSSNKSKKDGLNYRCKECQRAYFKDYYSKNKKKHIERVRKNTRSRRKRLQEFVRNLKNKPCTDCGNKYHHYAMDFDHIDSNKSFNISKGIDLGFSKEKLLKEIRKCELVCSNCHRVRTFNRRNEGS